MELVRGSGILLHISSLPGPYGIGDLGRGAFDFVDFLAESRQRYWQFLPLGPTSAISAYSPYMSFSALAGNSMFIDLSSLFEEGLVSREEFSVAPDFSDYKVDFDQVVMFHEKVMEKAFQEFSSACSPPASFVKFCEQEQWLADYALFMALREEENLLPWHQWHAELLTRESAALDDARERLAYRIEYHCFIQYCFFTQWRKLREYANSRGIYLVGDIPVYVAHDSVDVWANPECFRLDPDSLSPTVVAGVPPDYFSDTGQRWGNPLYRWQSDDGTDNRRLYDWWNCRFKAMFSMADICRIDHFRGFESYWEIDAAEETAINGQWKKGPGKVFFDEIEKQLGDLPIIAEDLGIITPEVADLRRNLGFPGMKILQFAFDSDETNPYLPHNFRSDNTVVYTGTHDNDTTLGWYMSDRVSEQTRKKLLRYSRSPGKNISRELITLALSSVARVAILPMQDLLGFGTDCRMNTPGTSEGNWQWRCASSYMNEEAATWLRGETLFYNRG